MSQLELLNSGGSPFDQIRKVDHTGDEFWMARELMTLLGYETWRRFECAIDRAKTACLNTGCDPESHFVGAVKMEQIGSTQAFREISDHKLSRYGCYLTAMNGDPNKPQIAAAQSYFAIKAHEAETASTEAEMPNIIERQIELERIKLERDKIALEREKLAITAKTPRPSAVKQPAKLTEPSYKEMQVIGYLKEHGSISDRQLVQKHWTNTCAEARRLLIALSNKGFGRVKRLGRVSMGLEASA